MKSALLFAIVSLQLSGTAFAQISLPADTLPLVDFPGAVWTPAAEGNFNPQNRLLDKRIDTIVIHDIEGSAAAGIGIFQRIGASVSAHYVVSGQGAVFQMVREENVGWHAGNSEVNGRSVGIEIEGYAYRPGWYSPRTYETVAALVRDVTRRHAIPRDRAHIIGHAEVPNPRDPAKFGGVSGHTDPGPYWDWTTFMTLVSHDSKIVEALFPVTIRPGEMVAASLKFRNTGDVSWLTNTAVNPRTALQAGGPIVVLGIEGKQETPLFNSQSWISPTVVAGASTETAPESEAVYEFKLRGPRELGYRSEVLRLTTMPTIAQGLLAVSFGDKITIPTRVVPWVIDVKSPDVASPDEQGKNPAPGKPIARWSATLPLGGIYAVYVDPPRLSKADRQKPFTYQLTSVDGFPSFEVPASEGGKGQVFAGYFQFPEPYSMAPALSVELRSAPQDVETRNAGSLCFIGPFPKASATPPDLSQIPGAVIAQPR